MTKEQWMQLMEEIGIKLNVLSARTEAEQKRHDEELAAISAEQTSISEQLKAIEAQAA